MKQPRRSNAELLRELSRERQQHDRLHELLLAVDKQETRDLQQLVADNAAGRRDAVPAFIKRRVAAHRTEDAMRDADMAELRHQIEAER
jgi:hypothetical protein